MTCHNDTKPLRDTFISRNRKNPESLARYRPEDAVGHRVRKLSGKAFSDGEKVAVVTAVVVHPYTGNTGFALASTVVGKEIADPIESGRCYFDKDHNPAWDRAG